MLWAIYDLDRPELKDEPFVPATHPRLSEGETPKSVFATLREGDVLLHHPYHSFATSVQRFIEQAAADPRVLAIKQTLYRTSGDSSIVNALIEAAEAGKQVVLVEIKARFDEEANITWARCWSARAASRRLRAGRPQDAPARRRWSCARNRVCCAGTATSALNYNPKTARIYEDLGILTADPRVGADLTDLFNTLNGYSRRDQLPHPDGPARHPRRAVREDPPRGPARRRGEALRHPHQGQLPGRREDHRRAVRRLTRRRAGGAADPRICALRPGVPGMSETIRVRSIVGRFLEHSRVMSFDNAGDPEWWIGIDLMHRNLDRRVEVLLRVCDEGPARSSRPSSTRPWPRRVPSWELSSDGAGPPPASGTTRSASCRVR